MGKAAGPAKPKKAANGSTTRVAPVVVPVNVDHFGWFLFDPQALSKQVDMHEDQNVLREGLLAGTLLAVGSPSGAGHFKISFTSEPLSARVERYRIEQLDFRLDVRHGKLFLGDESSLSPTAHFDAKGWVEVPIGRYRARVTSIDWSAEPGAVKPAKSTSLFAEATARALPAYVVQLEPVESLDAIPPIPADRFRDGIPMLRQEREEKRALKTFSGDADLKKLGGGAEADLVALADRLVEPRERLTAARAAVKLGPEEAWRRLSAFVKSAIADRDAIGDAVAPLGPGADARWAPFLVEALQSLRKKNETASSVPAILRALGRIADPSVVADLERLLAEDIPADWLIPLGTTLGALAPTAAGPLLDAWTRLDPTGAVYIETALRSFRGKIAIDAIRPSLERVPEPRRTAILDLLQRGF